MILYIENPKDVTRKLLEPINELDKVAGYKINTNKSLATKDQKKKLSKQSHLQLQQQQKNKISRNKPT